MNKRQLETNLEDFFQKCKDRNYTIEKYHLIENDTNFTLEVKAEWIEKIESYSDVLDILIPILWETTSLETRKVIFAISVKRL